MPEFVVNNQKSLFARFGTPRAIISDRGTHFCNDQFAKVMLKYGVTRRLSTAYHSQTSVQLKEINRGLKRILESDLSENRPSWSDKLDYALIGLPNSSFKHHRALNLTNLDMEEFHGARLKPIETQNCVTVVEVKVPFTVTQVFPYGVVELSQTDGPNFKDCPDYEDSRARGFVHRSLDLRSFAYHFVEIPSGESKVHIEVLSVLWGNRLLIPDGLLPLSRPRWQSSTLPLAMDVWHMIQELQMIASGLDKIRRLGLKAYTLLGFWILPLGTI
ncbi:reverse transcriptase domain-containing protein [Tanacetum coccineum]|uniref:Reverse transcriptase domain-containing protein n=1 Tax=Tanacetum coccineum TaxID=301880 RepID=A0ABQ4ZC00_9ASTR